MSREIASGAVPASAGNMVRRFVTVAIVITLFMPVLRNRDGLPLSTYPMYAGTRDAVLSAVVVEALDSQGAPVELEMVTLAGSRDPLVTQSHLEDTVRDGRAQELCVAISDRLGSGHRADRLEIAIERSDVVERMRGGDSPVEREVVASCEATQ